MKRRRSMTIGGPARIRRAAGLLALAWVMEGIGVLGVFGVTGVGPGYAATLPSAPVGSSSWTVYHGNPAGTGVAAPVTSVDTTTQVWTSPALDGQIYGEPLVYAGRVYVATENDTVYALSSASGSA